MIGTRPDVSLPAPKRVRVQGDLFHGVVPAGAVYVGRATPGLAGSRWANPFRVEHVARRGDAVDLFRSALTTGRLPRYTSTPFTVDDVRRELRGRDLACWCPLNGPCHADVLLELANGPPP